MDRYNPAQTPAVIEYDTGAAVLFIRYEGKVSADGLHRAHEAVLDRVDGGEVLGLVIDVRQSQPVYSPSELVESMESCVADMALERVALVAEGSRERLVMLMETVACGHGVRVRAFADAHEARCFASGA